eukprot:CAMPEP_0201873632 /NCGR_PEP_ID=MMETSP0902-20130614/6081_1 /ASSEMBLY_ACC=CAM_ASM_000551 /TAXON_ID=420261 /ORGANISM="Thalassiosira antarctica, Strain CCMP982" /LENGTH=411 /DNA_ID=CAMNT_0048400285 /DNA_START=147 /DNA_END=1383 /DNA_ORIENTATION=+
MSNLAELVEENSSELMDLRAEASRLSQQMGEMMEYGLEEGQDAAEHICILGAKMERRQQVNEQIRVVEVVQEERKKNKLLIEEYECSICMEELPSLDWSFSSFCHSCGAHLCTGCEEKLKWDPCPVCRQGTMGYIPKGGTVEHDKQVAALAARGHPAGQLLMFHCYQTESQTTRRNTNIAKDYAKAAHYLRLSASQGYSPAQVMLALYQKEDTFDQYNNPHILKNNREAVELLEDACKKGDPSAQMNLGFMYEKGMGVTKDNADAFRLCTLAAAAGQIAAQNHMAASYQLGRIVEKSPELSKYWAQIAARRGYPDSYIILGEAIEDMVESNFQGNISLTGHSAIPQILQLYRTAHAAGDPNSQWAAMNHITHYEGTMSKKLKLATDPSPLLNVSNAVSAAKVFGIARRIVR